MNKFRELAKKATEYCHEHSDVAKAWTWEDKFAEYIYKDIMTVVAAQALSNESALDVFVNLQRIYEGKELKPRNEPLECPIDYED